MKIVLTKEEMRNGWTPETLAEYLNGREDVAAEKIDPRSQFNRRAKRPAVMNGKYRPLRWRG